MTKLTVEETNLLSIYKTGSRQGLIVAMNAALPFMDGEMRGFCNTVLHNEACDAHRELHRHKAREVTFSDLPLDEARQLHTFDEYFKRETAETVFEKAGKKITPKLLLEAIRTLPEEKRKAVLLYYFEGMNDTEIAKLFNTSRSTIQYRRTSSFEKLRKYLEENADEWDEW